MNRALVLKGQSNSGKTTVLNDFYDWIKANHQLSNLKEWRKDDIHSEFLIGKLKIAFNSCGDEGPYLDSFLKDCIHKKIDFIICACRAKGATNHAVKNNLQHPHYIVDIVATYHVNPTQIASFQAIWLDEVKARIIGLPKP